MNLIDCLEIYSTFKDDELLITKKGQCEIEIDNKNKILYIKILTKKDRIFYNENFEYHIINHKVIFFFITYQSNYS